MLPKETLVERGIFNPKNYVLLVIAFPLVFAVNYFTGHGAWITISNAALLYPGDILTYLQTWKIITYSLFHLLWFFAFSFIAELLPVSILASIVSWIVLIFIIP